MTGADATRTQADVLRRISAGPVLPPLDTSPECPSTPLDVMTITGRLLLRRHLDDLARGRERAYAAASARLVGQIVD